jgi:hypothetical protein
MPQIVAAAIAKAAIAAPAAAAATTAAAVPAAAAATTAAGTTAAQTLGLEAAKKLAIEKGMQTGIQQVGQTAAGEAAKQAGVEAAKQGIAQVADDAASLAIQGAGGSSYTTPGATPIPSYVANAPAPAAPLPPAGGSPFNPAGSPELTQSFMPNRPPLDPNLSSQRLGELNAKFPNLRSDLSAQPPQLGDPGTFARTASDPGLSKLMTSPADELMGVKETAFPLAPKNALEKGFETALKYAQDNPVTTGLGIMSAGQYLNKDDGSKSKEKYKNKVDMSKFKPSVPSAIPFTPSYSYAVGGPVEQMSAMNAVGDNTMYPQSQFQTPMYSNPMVQRPTQTNVIAHGLDAPVSSYTGEQKLATGGISREEAEEYGLKTRKQRATKGLSSAYEDMEKEREKQMAVLRSIGDKQDSGGTIPRSRIQQLTSPFSAAQEEYKRLAKKSRVPVAEMPKTNLGDIDNYMDTPIEAAGGGIMGSLGSYSDGGRLLRGPGDGVSDSIPAVIGKRQPARLADGEFVIPARIVSELGNGSTEAGARKLYAMMERIQNTRKKSIGKKKVAVNSRADKHLPA